MESQRVYRPRLLIHGAPGMGQSMIGGAALHHLEGVHIQSLDLGTLFGDSTKVRAAACCRLPYGLITLIAVRRSCTNPTLC